MLDVLAAALPVRQLSWHYRSRDERLIAFANQAMYDGGLTTFPGTAIESAVSFEPVDGQSVIQPGEQTIESTGAEVDRVVALVLEHARTRPHESLGVIALGIKHARLLDEAMTTALRDAGDVADFFDPDRDEHFFVKNLERVQGDERDAIILSIGYGKTPHGRVLHRFGPLNIEGGERRLNVAITRARNRMTVVSALRASDLDPARLRARGAMMLREFLAYAESGGVSVPSTAGAGIARGVAPPSDALRHDLVERLRREGLVVHEDYGTAAQRVDVAIEDPFHPGRALVAVETDGLRYASMRSTRDRDRLRPEQLERLGWTHVRVWSTDLFRDPAREIARILKIARQGPPPAADQGATLEAAGPDVAGVGSASPGGAAPGNPRADGSPPGGPGPASPSPKRRRRVFRKGTAETAAEDSYGPGRDDTDSGWGEPGQSTSRDQWLQEQRPPHYE